jgi:flagellar hook-associated protein 2
MSISVSGLISGLDTDSIISELLTVQQQPILNLQEREADYQVQLSAYGSLQSTLSSLKSAAEAIEEASDFTAFTATSGDTDLFDASASESATPGSHKITVTQLAEAHKLKSTSFSNGEEVGEGTMHLKVGSGSTVDIVVAASDTIDQVAQAINDAEAGVQAAVIYDGSDYFLTLAADDTGADNVINLTVTDTGDGNNTDTNGLSRLVYDEGTTENLTETQAAANSIITVDGVPNINRASNTIDDVITGVTISLKSDSDTDTATLTVTRDTAAIVSKINAFVTAYNEVLNFFSNYQSYDQETGTAGILFGDGTTNSIRSRLRNMIAWTVPGVESFDRLADLGVTLTSGGQLEVDSATLNAALDDHFDDVVQFFTQSDADSEGFAVRMVDTLDAMLDSTDGTIAAKTDGIQKSIDDIQDQVERIETRISAWETRTRAEFQALELLLAEYQATSSYLDQQLTGLTNLNNYISKIG